MKKLLPLLIVFFGFNSFAQTDEIKREAAGISYLSMHDLNSSEYVFNFENLSESEAFLIKEKLFGFHQVYFQNWASNFSYVEIKFSWVSKDESISFGLLFLMESPEEYSNCSSFHKFLSFK